MTAPLPELGSLSRGGDRFADTFRPRDAVFIKVRGQHVPTWYDPAIHQNPETIVVKSGGLPLKPYGAPASGWRQFTVAEVLPEWRWVIRADGEILPQHEFEPLYRRKLEEYYNLQGVKYPGNTLREHIAQASYYVSFTADRDGKPIPIGYDPHPPKTGERTTLYDARKDEVIRGEERLDLLVSCYRDEKLRRRMKPEEVAEVERHLGIVAEPKSAEEEVAQAILAAKLSPDALAALLAKLAPQSAPVEQPKARKRPAMKTMACGAEIHTIQIARHRKTCQTCSEPAADATPGTAA